MRPPCERGAGAAQGGVAAGDPLLRAAHRLLGAGDTLGAFAHMQRVVGEIVALGFRHRTERAPEGFIVPRVDIGDGRTRLFRRIRAAWRHARCFPPGRRRGLARPFVSSPAER